MAGPAGTYAPLLFDFRGMKHTALLTMETCGPNVTRLIVAIADSSACMRGGAAAIEQYRPRLLSVGILDIVAATAVHDASTSDVEAQSVGATGPGWGC